MGKLNPQIVRGIGNRIKEVREAAGISKEELCRKAQLKSENVLSLIEQGVYAPRSKHVAAIAKATGTTEEYLLFNKKPDLNIKIPATVTPPATDDKGKEAEPAAAAVEDIPGGKDTLYSVNNEAVRAARRKAGLSVEEAAKRSGISMSTIYRCETTTPAATGYTINALARTYGVRAAELVVGTGQKRLVPLEARGKHSGVHYNKALLRELREKTGYSRTKVQEESGIPALTLKDWENDKKNTKISLDRLKKVADVYGVPVETLVVTDEPAGYAVDMEKAGKTIEPDNSDAGAAAEMPEVKETVKDAAKLPDDPEKQFCKNILFYIRNSGCNEEEFDNVVGCTPDFFSEAIEHGYKLPLGVSLKAARFFGKTLEETVYDTTVMELEAELEKIKERLKELNAILGKIPD